MCFFKDPASQLVQDSVMTAGGEVMSIAADTAVMMPPPQGPPQHLPPSDIPPWAMKLKNCEVNV